jgi:heme-degrading monooxygenase HmoA
MWAQMITTRLKPGREGDLAKLTAQLKATEQPGSGLVHSTATRDAKDPSRVIMFVVFDSEEKARERENDARRQEGLEAARATMMEIFEGAPEFTDLTVVDDWSL